MWVPVLLKLPINPSIIPYEYRYILHANLPIWVPVPTYYPPPSIRVPVHILPPTIHKSTGTYIHSTTYTYSTPIKHFEVHGWAVNIMQTVNAAVFKVIQNWQIMPGYSDRFHFWSPKSTQGSLWPSSVDDQVRYRLHCVRIATTDVFIASVSMVGFIRPVSPSHLKHEHKRFVWWGQ